jgi:hypothetical protein
MKKPKMEKLANTMRHIFVEWGSRNLARILDFNKGFNFDEEAVEGLVRRGTATHDTVVLVVVPTKQINIIKSPLLVDVNDPHWGGKTAFVIPCADLAQMERMGRKFGDKQYQRQHQEQK